MVTLITIQGFGFMSEAFADDWWTIMVYIAADNNLSSYGAKDLEEIQNAMGYEIEKKMPT